MVKVSVGLRGGVLSISAGTYRAWLHNVEAGGWVTVPEGTSGCSTDSELLQEHLGVVPVCAGICRGVISVSVGTCGCGHSFYKDTWV